MQIPTRNLYYLLCYAWDVLEGLEHLSLSAKAADRPADLFAKVLSAAVAKLLRRGFDRQYLESKEDLSVIRGKIDLSETSKRLLLRKGRAACTFTELDHDVLHNQVIKATLSLLAADAEIDRDIRAEIRGILRRLSEISDRKVAPSDFSKIQLHRNNVVYRFALNVCELVQRFWIPDATTGRHRFHDFRGDEREMGLVFEHFVRNFLRREQNSFRVVRDQIAWASRVDSDEITGRWLPAMQTDISLRSGGRLVIVETKCVNSPLQDRHGRRTLRSDHLYQLFAYLRNLHAEQPFAPAPAGVLLYATMGARLKVDLDLHGHPMMARSIDLSQPWTEVRNDLFQLVRELEGCDNPCRAQA
jgi:5-methylcytosine-specific restriction enzyme subunit McrC